MTGPVAITLVSIAEISAEFTGLPLSWLSAQEQVRHQSITAPRRRHQFLAGRWLARHCMAAWQGGDWQAYGLSAPEAGRPEVRQVPPHVSAADLHVSLSHSGDWLACAVAGQPVGIDVEDASRDRDVDALGDAIYGASERAALSVMSAQARRAYFFSLWTLKEAWIKQAPGGPSMSSLEFAACAREQRSQAVVLSTQTFVLAVARAQPQTLTCHGSALHGLPMMPWRRLSTAS